MSANDVKNVEKRQSRLDQVNWGLVGWILGVFLFWMILAKMIALALLAA